MDPVFGEKIVAVRQACEMLEMQYNSGPTSVLGDFCVRVFVPPFNNSYTVRQCRGSETQEEQQCLLPSWRPA